MKEFLNTINWKAFAYQMLAIFIFLSLSYWAGNNKFPNKVWTVPVITIVIELLVLFQVYYNFRIKKDIEERNGKNNR